MRSLKLNNSGDIDFTSGGFSIVTGQDEIRQKTELILNIRKGEWFLDVNTGLDHTNILGKSFDQALVREAIIEGLRQEPRVLEIDFVSVNIDRQARNTTVEFRFTTSEGTVEGEVTL